MAAIHSVVDRGAEVAVPWLLVHGTQDDVVPLQDSRDIAARAPRARLVELPGAGHLFGDGATPAMVRVVVDWVGAQMGASNCGARRLPSPGPSATSTSTTPSATRSSRASCHRRC